MNAVANGTATIVAIVVLMALIGLIETIVPMRPRGRWHRAHLGPNLALTLLTFATNLLFNAAVVAVLVRLQGRTVGLLQWWSPSPWLAVVLVLVGLDLSFYVAHVAMHEWPWLWRVHRVHHSDPAVDVTTTIRQHPVEGVIRYAFMAAFAFALGATPAAFAVYRVWSAVHGLTEHANVRIPLGLDRVLCLIFTTPNMHKVHHSRFAADTNTNYGNIFSVFDRAFHTLTPSERGLGIVYGLAGFDDPATQSTRGLLAMPLRSLPLPLATHRPAAGLGTMVR